MYKDLWTKRCIVAGGETTVLNRGTKIDCPEIFDFLYLKKAIPYGRLVSWAPGNDGVYPFYAMLFLTWNLDAFEGWCYFLSYSLRVLEPHDMAELIGSRAWVGDDTYPPDKIM